MRVETSGSVLISPAKVAVVVPQPPPQRKALAFAILCLGCFIAFLDIQIVSASIEESCVILMLCGTQLATRSRTLVA